MNRNVESHFSELPQVDIQRSMFDRSSSHKTSFNVGELIPFYIDEVLPGDTFNVTTSCVVRLQTPLTPIMDNIYLDTYYFFVPNRLVWSHWKEFMGENSESAWIPQTEYTIPKLYPPASGWSVGSIADYLGVPPLKGYTQDGNHSMIFPSALPFRAYALICNEWFRDQNLTDPLNITIGDTSQTGVAYGNNYRTDVELGGAPFKVAKYHDYFTSALPAPQKGPSVGLFPSSSSQAVGNLGGYYAHRVPVIAGDIFDVPSNNAINYYDVTAGGNAGIGRVIKDEGAYQNLSTVGYVPNVTLHNVVPNNLWVDLSKSGITVNELRQAFQLQKFFEKNARAGSRYREILKEHFGVTSSDARMQIPEYLGGHRFPLSIHQVSNTSEGDSSFLGDLGAMSNTSDVHDDFVRSFEEHGFVIGVCCVRYDHSYPQGLERFWMRRNKVDYYWPVFANLGEQIVYKGELYWQESITQSSQSGSIFGYQEAWADYRYKPSRVSGEMRPDVPNSLASWHLSDNYSSEPTLSDSWIREDKSTVDRVLSVSSSVANQVFADFYVKNIATRPMPMYSIPGLIDHH